MPYCAKNVKSEITILNKSENVRVWKKVFWQFCSKFQVIFRNRVTKLIVDFFDLEIIEKLKKWLVFQFFEVEKIENSNFWVSFRGTQTSSENLKFSHFSYLRSEKPRVKKNFFLILEPAYHKVMKFSYFNFFLENINY